MLLYFIAGLLVAILSNNMIPLPGWCTYIEQVVTTKADHVPKLLNLGNYHVVLFPYITSDLFWYHLISSDFISCNLSSNVIWYDHIKFDTIQSYWILSNFICFFYPSWPHLIKIDLIQYHLVSLHLISPVLIHHIWYHLTIWPHLISDDLDW